MKYIKQFTVILTISCIGEICSYLIPAPIPASIYGILLLFLGLVTGIVPYESVKDVGHFLIEIMPVMFIPAAVGLIDSWTSLQGALLPYLIVTVVTTVLVMVVAGRVTQFISRRKERSHD